MKLRQARALHTTHDRCVVHPKKEDRMIPDMKMDDEIRELLQLCVAQGWRLEEAGTAGKIKCFPPDKDKPATTIPSRGIGRSYKNIVTQLRKSGLVIPDNTKPKESGVKVDIIELKKGQPIPDLPPGEVVLDLRDVASDDLVKKVHSLITEDASGQIADIMAKFTLAQRQATLDASGALVALMGRFLAVMNEAGKVDDKLETQALEAMESLEQAEKRISRLEDQVSSLGIDLKEALEESVRQQERAIAAENRLATITKAINGATT